MTSKNSSPPVSPNAVILAEADGKPFRDFLEHGIAGLVPKLIIYFLEVIHVNQDNPHRSGVAPGASQFTLHKSKNFSAVPRPSQKIVASGEMQSIIGRNEFLLQLNNSLAHRKSRLQLEGVEWLREKVVHARVHCLQHFTLASLGRHQNRARIGFIFAT